MKIYTREEWMQIPELKMLARVAAMPEKRCQCGTKEHLVELIDHESCIVGRIDTVICSRCKEVESFSIIR